MIYLNNAATSYPKPNEVAEALTQALNALPCEPGRSTGYDISVVRSNWRQQAAKLFSVPEPNQVIAVPGATYALNLVVASHLRQAPKGARVITSVLEHNSLLRPLYDWCAWAQCELIILPCTAEGLVDPQALETALKPGSVALVALGVASNVCGAIQDTSAFAELAARYDAPLLLDAAQSAGLVALDYAALPGRVFVAMAGHKALYGPPGTGLLLVPDAQLAPAFSGGTGVVSESREMPLRLPLRYEAGTPNMPALAGLGAGIDFVFSKEVKALGAQRARLVAFLREELKQIQGLELFPLANEDGRLGIVSFVEKRRCPDETGYLLRSLYSIETRSGLHCAPLIHKALGISPQGCVRVSVGAYTTEEDLFVLVRALKDLANE